MQVDFYQLGPSAVEAVLPRIAERVLADGGRLLVVAGDAALAARLDATLWEGDGFLPHGRAGEDDETIQPLLIAAGCDATNGARNIALADGAWRGAALGFDRAFLLFGEDRLAEARAAWKALATSEGVERRFWKQDGAGKWGQAG